LALLQRAGSVLGIAVEVNSKIVICLILSANDYHRAAIQTRRVIKLVLLRIFHLAFASMQAYANNTAKTPPIISALITDKIENPGKLRSMSIKGKAKS